MSMSTWSMYQQEYDDRNNLLVVDGLNLAFRWKHKGQFDFAADFLKTINSLAKSYSARKIVVLTDYKGSAYRKDLHPGYKSDRKLKFQDQTEEEKEAAAMFFDGYNKALDLCDKSLNVWKFKGVEADDLACYIVERFEDGESFDHIWLISTDVDWDTLLGERVSRFAYTSRKEFTMDNYYDEHNCDTPEEFAAMKAIMGDPGDSVYGVDGIGAKRAYNLVRQYGNALDLALELPLEGKQMYVKNLNQSYDKLILNTQLVDLRSFHKEAIAFANEENLSNLEQLCQDLEL